MPSTFAPARPGGAETPPFPVLSPSQSKVLSAWLNWLYGLVTSKPRRLKASNICFCHQSAEGFVHGSMAPPARLLVRAGVMRSSSYCRMLAKPLQAGAGPPPVLKEKDEGVRGREGRPQDRPHR